MDWRSPAPVAGAAFDVRDGMRQWRLWTFLARRDISNRYRRSFVGPLWTTLTTAIFLGAVAVVYSRVFGVGIRDYLPYLACGIIVWQALTSVLNEMAGAYTSSIHFVLNLPGPKSTYLFRVLVRTQLTFLHVLPIWIIVVLVLGVPVGWPTLLFLPGAMIALSTVFLIGTVLACLSARVRDVPVLLSSLLQVTFFVTPVMWESSLLTGDARVILLINPFVPLVDVMRAPLLGQAPSLATWFLCVGLLVLSAMIAAWIFVLSRPRLAFWL